jgi:hypothetical protein
LNDFFAIHSFEFHFSDLFSGQLLGAVIVNQFLIIFVGFLNFERERERNMTLLTLFFFAIIKRYIQRQKMKVCTITCETKFSGLVNSFAVEWEKFIFSHFKKSAIRYANQ